MTSLTLDLCTLVSHMCLGKVVGFPTDTVYALAADPQSADGVAELYKIKNRDSKKSIALLASNVATVEQLASLDQVALDIIKNLDELYPGLITFVLAARNNTPYSSNGRIGVRFPKSKTALSVLGAFGRPVAATSLNKAGEHAAACYADIAIELKDKYHILPDSGEEVCGLSSTVLDISQIGLFRIVRASAVSAKNIEEYFYSQKNYNKTPVSY